MHSLQIDIIGKKKLLNKLHTPEGLNIWLCTVKVNVKVISRGQETMKKYKGRDLGRAAHFKFSFSFAGPCNWY